jgi:HNH endonuclease
MDITQELLKKVLHYSPETGCFTWLVNAGRYGRIKPGTEAGSHNKANGYHSICIDGKGFPSHRLAFLYLTGAWPTHEVDHINRIRHDNRWCNLREAILQQNLQNKTRYSSNTSGFPGVTWHKRIGKWQARLGGGRKREHLGYWDDISQAAAAYNRAKAAKSPFSTGQEG